MKASPSTDYKLKAFTSTYTVKTNIDVNIQAELAGLIDPTLTSHSYENEWAYVDCCYIYNPNNVKVNAQIEWWTSSGSSASQTSTLEIEPYSERLSQFENRDTGSRCVVVLVDPISGRKSPAAAICVRVYEGSTELPESSTTTREQ